MAVDLVAVAGLAFTAGGSVGSLITWVLGRRKERRAALPILRRTGQLITMVNRMDEDLVLTRIEPSGRYVLQMPLDAAGSIDWSLAEWLDYPMNTKATIAPRKEAEAQVFFEPGTPSPTVTFVFSSSAGTLKNERMTVDMFTVVDPREPRHRLPPASEAASRRRRRWW